MSLCKAIEKIENTKKLQDFLDQERQDPDNKYRVIKKRVVGEAPILERCCDERMLIIMDVSYSRENSKDSRVVLNSNHYLCQECLQEYYIEEP